MFVAMVKFSSCKHELIISAVRATFRASEEGGLMRDSHRRETYRSKRNFLDPGRAIRDRRARDTGGGNNPARVLRVFTGRRFPD